MPITTEKTKHTPGPWQITWYPQSQSAEIETVEQEFGLERGKYRHITNSLPMSAGINNDEIELIKDEDGREYRYSAEACANARLMAASPELLQALEYVQEIIRIARKYFPKSMHNSDRFQLENTCATVGSAIRKAKGE